MSGKKECGCKWTWDIIHFFTQIKVKEQRSAWHSTLFVITGWRFELVAANESRNQSVCMLQKHVFCREKVKKWNGHVYACAWGTSKNAQHPMRNFQKYTKSHEELPKIHKIPWENMHKIPRGSSNDAQNPTRKFQNVHNPMRNSQICTKSHEKLPRIPWEASTNPMKNFQKCTKSNEELPKNVQNLIRNFQNMHKMPWGTSKNPMRNFQKCTKSHEELPKMHKMFLAHV